MKPSTTEFNLQPHYYLSEIELLILSLSFLFSKMNLVRKGISVYLVVSTVLSLELIYNKCYLCHQYYLFFFFFKIHSCVTFWLVLVYFIHSLQSSSSKYLLELIWEILDISLILWVFSLSIYISMLFFFF